MKNKPKILFIVNELDSGGVSKSLTSLLNVIDKDRFDISLMMLHGNGALRALVPEGIEMLSDPLWDALTSPFSGMSHLLKKRPHLLLGHLGRLVMSKLDKAYAAFIISRLLPRLKEKFDLVVDYGGQQQLYYMVDKIDAVKKISFFHSDYSQWPHYYKMDRRYYPKVDKIFAVSGQCVDSMKKWFPDIVDKIDLMENISSLDLISRMAEENIPEMEDTVPVLLTVSRITEKKGIDLALEAAMILKKQGTAFRWYFLGYNENPAHYQSLVQKYELKDNVTFLGVRTNPYPYMKKADIIVHPSKYEGKSIALDEVKLLLKPAVVTNFSTVGDQFENGVNATICEMTPGALADGIMELLSNPSLQKKYRDNLLNQRSDNTAEINKLYALIEEK